MRAVFLPMLLFVFCPVALTQETSAQEDSDYESIPLWPDDHPYQMKAGEGDVPRMLLRRIESDRPTAAVVVLPGGGYGGHAIGHEGYEIADWFRSMGITPAICLYRLRGKGNDGEGYGHPWPMRDAQRAVQMLRANAQRWNIDPQRIGVIGFSAGGHLASTISTHFAEDDTTRSDSDVQDRIAKQSSRPDFAILCYPVIAFDQPYTHRGSQRNLLGENADAELTASLSNERQVTERTPPTFLFHTVEDTVVPIENSIEYFLACKRQQVPVELHAFQKGRHGLGLARNAEDAAAWPALCEDWLKRLGVTGN